jgi:pilus assembly protein Flp/PilA
MRMLSVFTTLFKRLQAECSGATAIEYGLIAALIVVASLFAMQAMAGESTLTWTTVAQKVSDAIPPPAG